MQIIVIVHQFIKKLLVKSKNAAGQVIHVIQVKIQFVQDVNISQGRNQEYQQGRNQSHQNHR